MTLEFVKGGFSVLEPRDILCGHDLSCDQEQQSVWRDIDTFKPELIWIAYCGQSRRR